MSLFRREYRVPPVGTRNYGPSVPLSSHPMVPDNIPDVDQWRYPEMPPGYRLRVVQRSFRKRTVSVEAYMFRTLLFREPIDLEIKDGQRSVPGPEVAELKRARGLVYEIEARVGLAESALNRYKLEQESVVLQKRTARPEKLEKKRNTNA